MENMSEGLAITVIGLCIVFAVLVILWGFIALMRVVFVKKTDKPATVTPAPVPEVKPEVLVSSPAQTEEEDMDAIVAAITAAVASSLNTSTYRLRIRSIKRADSRVPAWNAASRRENIDNKY